MTRYAPLVIAAMWLPAAAQAPPASWSPEYAAEMRLEYRQPAAEWVEGLPVGNGRMGAMVFGRPGRERIQLNEESVYAGRRMDDHNPGALEHLDEIRRLIFEDREPEATALAIEHLAARPLRMRPYQTLMDLTLDLGHGEVQGYTRGLDLETGIAWTDYVAGGIRHTRQVFASAVDDVVVIRLEASAPGRISTTLALDREANATVRATGEAELLLSGRIDSPEEPGRGPAVEGVRFAGRLRAVAEGGTVRSTGDSLRVDGADALTLVIASATDYDLQRLDADRQLDPDAMTAERIAAVAPDPYADLLARHLADHRPRMGRFVLDLTPGPIDAAPTDERLAAIREGAVDPGLTELYVQYGRYLLLASSRAPGRLPANLQGIWNESLAPIWDSDYHVNINLQMNYWPAEVLNLPETVEPLTGFVYELREPGAVAARETYGAGGWMMHHNTDIFGRMGLHDAVRWAITPLGGAWLTFPVWRHYVYSGDETYLRDTAYPILRGASQFALDLLIESPEGYLVTSPTYSSEHEYIHPESGEPLVITYAATTDTQILQELLAATIQASEVLDVDAQLRDSMRAALERLPPVRIGADGTIMEWIEDYEEAEPGHRHMSHLIGLHPGATITPETPELFEASRATIDRRLANGGGHTGWSRAWIVNLFARLGDGEAAHDNLLELYRQSTISNLFNTHPPFQIDGNFGGAAGIAEMLIQSHQGAIDLLPAIPEAWSTGRVEGLRAAGGVTVDIAWDDGAITEATLVPSLDGPITVRAASPLDVVSGTVLDRDGDRLRLDARAGVPITLRPAG